MDKTVTVLQFTDTHIYGDPDRRMKGVDTFETLGDVLNLAYAQESDVNAIVLTGDISQDMTVGSYERLAQRFEEFIEQMQSGGDFVPLYYIPGNHDCQSNMVNSLFRHPIFRKESHVEVGEWLLIFSDSTIADKVEGWLSDEELGRLDELIEAAGVRKHVAVFLHHNAVNLHPSRPDPIMLLNAEAFLNVLDRYDNVRVVVCGHVHQDFRTVRNGVSFLTSPSTCVQFCPTATGIAIAASPPGYRCLRLLEDGNFATRVRRLSNVPSGLILTGRDLG